MLHCHLIFSEIELDNLMKLQFVSVVTVTLVQQKRCLPNLWQSFDRFTNENNISQTVLSTKAARSWLLYIQIVSVLSMLCDTSYAEKF